MHNLKLDYVMNFLNEYYEIIKYINKFLHNIYSDKKNINEEYKYKWVLQI